MEHIGKIDGIVDGYETSNFQRVFRRKMPDISTKALCLVEALVQDFNIWQLSRKVDQYRGIVFVEQIALVVPM